MSFTTPTTLPSIQFLLAQQTSEDKKLTKGHRSTRSVSSLPSELQNLSLNGPSLQGTSPSKDDSHLPKTQPNWINGPPSSIATLVPNPPSTSSAQRQPSIAYHHQRSTSDLSMTAPTVPSAPHPTSYHPFNSFDHAANPVTSATPDVMRTSLAPHQNHQLSHQRQRHLSHRRALSATTVDHIMQPPVSSSTSIPPPVPPLPFYHRALSDSPPENHLSLGNTNSHPAVTCMDRSSRKHDSVSSTITPQPPSSSSSIPSSSTHTNLMATKLATPSPSKPLPTHDTTPGQQQAQPTHAVVNGMELPRDISGRYLCPFCQKAFSRPSSLRIHTYSHTKEKPFACPECPRQFSVQSNMRRHLRIHLIRPTNKTSF